MLKLSLKVITLILILQIASLIFTPFTVAKADDLIIDYDGKVTLIITDNSVLGSETSKTEKAPDTTIKINPQINTDDKKLKITIEKTTTKPETENKTVDNVILRDVDKKPIIDIKPSTDHKNEIKIEQKDTSASTQLPLQIDTKTHVVSVETTSNTTQKVSILPDQAIQGANQEIKSNANIIKSDVKLVSGTNGQAEYIVNQQRSGKLLGIFNITIPSQVKISAQTGKTSSVWESPLAIFEFLIK